MQPVVLITGAAGGLGRALAQRFHQGNWRVVVTDQNAAGLAQLGHEMPLAGCITADLRTAAACRDVVERTLGRVGRLDALVNNASAFYPTPVGGATPAQWEELFAVNARAPFFLAQAAAPHLRAARGAIVNIADIYAEKPRADLAVYAASKAALLAVSRGLAASLAPEVRVNAVSPGAILWPDGGIDPHVQDRLLAQTPLGRIGDPGDIAGTVAWLLGNTAGYVTGQVIHVDGGRHIT